MDCEKDGIRNFELAACGGNGNGRKSANPGLSRDAERPFEAFGSHVTIGFDIGGTKCAVIVGQIAGAEKPVILEKRQFPTMEHAGPERCIAQLLKTLDEISAAHPEWTPESVGISCGGPLDPVRGIIQAPPNLPGWDDVPIAEICRKHTGLPVHLQNDANSCALAEWRFGAGRGCRNMIFLTFGTGLGAGIIVNGKILNGASGMAGECGHVRLEPDGPVGYHKHGSFEGFCSGGGLAQLGRLAAENALQKNRPCAWCPDVAALSSVNARTVAAAADAGDAAALAVYRDCGRHLGAGLSILIDILNPERIVIGSIFARSEHLLRGPMEEVIRQEALEQSWRACRIVPAQLGESLGDIAALTAGLE